jgi:hypothetical protein
MDVVVGLLLIAIAAAPVAFLAGWFVGPGVRGVAQLVGRGNDDWWRSTLPWPTGVQEDDGVAWSARPAMPAGDDPEREGSAGMPSLQVPTRRLRPTLRRR